MNSTGENSKTHNNLQVLKTFKTQLIAFLDELIEQFPEEGDLILLRIMVKDRIPIQHVMERTKYKLDICRKMIENKDDEFFLQNDSLFSSVSKGKVNHFKRLWRSERLDDEDKGCMWQWMESFVTLADMYQT